MNAKDIEVRCPCCETRLLVDLASGKILKTTPAPRAAGHAPEETAPRDRWESAQQRVRDRTQTSSSKLESALEAERTKEGRFDELFQKAREKQDRRDLD
jgi:hypothetical protein